DGPQGGLALRPRPALRPRGQPGQVALRGGRLPGRRHRPPDPRRPRLRPRIPRRALLSRSPPDASGPDQPGDGPQLHRRARPRLTPLLLTHDPAPLGSRLPSRIDRAHVLASDRSVSVLEAPVPLSPPDQATEPDLTTTAEQTTLYDLLQVA